MFHYLFLGLQSTLALASMEMRSEDAIDISIFFYLVNDMLRHYTGDPNYKFNPGAFISDHAGANWRAIENIFSRDTAMHKLVLSIPVGPCLITENQCC